MRNNLLSSSSLGRILDESLFEEYDEEQLSSSKHSKFFEIITNPVYLCSCLSITSLLFISTAIIFWATDYFFNVLNSGKENVLPMFILISLTGPVLGIIIGGAIVQKLAKGYEGKHSIFLCLIFGICAFSSTIPVSFVDNKYIFSVILWSVLFFGGAIVPNIQGIMISSLQPNLRAAGNSLSNILQNSLGFLPAPFVYGIIYDYTKSTQPKLAMIVILSYSIVGVIFIGIAMIFRYKYWEEFKKRGLKNEEIEKEKEDLLEKEDIDDENFQLISENENEDNHESKGKDNNQYGNILEDDEYLFNDNDKNQNENQLWKE